MRAWMFDGVGQPLRRDEIPEPTPSKDEVAVDVRASGLCHTDVGIMNDETWLPRVGANVPGKLRAFTL